MSLTKKQKADFIEALEQTGVVARSARLADIPRLRDLYLEKETDDDFRHEWNAAYEIGKKTCEDQARMRAFFGVDKPIYQGGAQVGSVKEFSDTLAKTFLEADSPERFRKTLDVNVDAKVKKELKDMSTQELEEYLAKNIANLGIDNQQK